MHTNTRKRIDLLQQFIEENVGGWFKQYGDNLTSVQVHKKVTKRKKKAYYAIAFHVVKKKRNKQLDKNEVIPATFFVPFPDGKIRQIKTDVLQTGEFRVHAAPLDAVRDLPTGETGSLGLFVHDGHGNAFAVTNFHVAAQHLLRNGILHYDAQTASRYDVGVAGFTGQLFKGVIDPKVDVAFVGLGPVAVNNILPDGVRINNTGIVPGPLNATLRGKPLRVYLRRYGSSKTKTVKSNAAPCNARFMQFIQFVTIDSCAVSGDSGGVVLLGNTVLGIIFGSDSYSTFIIPYYNIFDFLSFRII